MPFSYEEYSKDEPSAPIAMASTEQSNFRQDIALAVVRGVINDKEGKAAALPKFSLYFNSILTKGADYAHPLALLAKKIPDYAPE